MPKQIPTSVSLDLDHRERIAQLAEWNDMNRSEVLRRGVRLLHAMQCMERATANDMGEHGPVFLRVVAELGSERVVNKTYRGVELDCGPGILIDDEFVFYIEPKDDSLMAMQEVGGQKVIFRVEGGTLVAAARFPAANPQLN